jgi:hypothetical protein
MTPTRATVITVSVIALGVIGVLLLAADVTSVAKVLLIVLAALFAAVVAVALPAGLRKRFAPFVAVFVAAVGLISALVPEDGGSSNRQTPSRRSGPTGDLSFDSVGAVKQGMTMAQVEELFGRPSRKEQTSSEAETGALKTWTWDLPSGRVSVSFSGSDGRMINYGTNSPRLPTAWGPRIGDSFTSLQDVWGTALKPVTLGSDTSDPTNGLWIVSDSKRGNSLLFRISDGAISSIWGGSSLIAE